MANSNYLLEQSRMRNPTITSRRPPDYFLDAWPLQLLFYSIIATIPFFKFRQLGDLFFLKLDWLLTASLLLMVIPVLLITKAPPTRLRSNVWAPLLLFFFVNTIATILSPFPQVAVAGMIVLSQVVAFAIVNTIMLNDRGIETFLPWVLSLSVGANAALALIGTTFGLEAFVEGGRALGGTITSNNMALMSVFSFPIALYLVLHSHGFGLRILAALFLFLIVAGLITSGSRGGFLNFTIMLVLLGWTFRHRFNVRYLGILFAGVGLALLAFLTTVPQNYWERQATLGLLGTAVTEDGSGLREDSSLERRAAYLVVVWDAVKERPILGFGTNAFQELWFNSKESDAFDKERRPAHNTYAEVLVGSGVIGLGAFLVLLAIVYRNYSLAEGLLRSAEDKNARDLIAMYRIAFISVLFYFLVKSGIDHKLFILAVALSASVRRYAEERYARALMVGEQGPQMS